MLNAFQRAGRAMLEQLLPSLHHPKECPDAMVDGWGDVHAGRSGATTVTLVSAKCALADDPKKFLARLRLGRDADQTWRATVSIVASPDAQTLWPPPGAEIDWWTAQSAEIRSRIAQHRHPLTK
ncbi:MAG TPA: hypothetical protein VGK15_05890 [Candidatus Limnocylindria bacterium]|jgi:hypothetical protein